MHVYIHCLLGIFYLYFWILKLTLITHKIIFTTHDTWQLSNQLLRRDEIWFVEKNEKGISTLYSLADFVDEDGARIRKDEAMRKIIW